MTDSNKPRWSAERKREGRQARGGKEHRANYAGDREVRQFGVAVTNGPAVRASGGSMNNSTAATITGSPVVYGQSYQVFDRWGSFIETVKSGALTAILPTCDTRFFYNHDGLTLARTTSGTLVLTDTPQSLNCTATLDHRQTAASDLVLAIGRGDINQMSVSFLVGDDVWDADFENRIITSFAELLDVSAVAIPASPTTSIELLDVPEHLLPSVGGDDGTLGGGGGNAPGMGNDDGTGSRSAKPDLERLLQIDQDRLRLARPPVPGR
jgi:HK97 family phage prohead protease